MKSTGMVRRIDALGRVVIPKEIRRTMKIQDNDPLEIFIDDEHIIFKKYSEVFKLETMSLQLADILYKQQAIPVVVCDMDKVIAVAGIPKNEVINRPISHAFRENLKALKSYDNKTDSNQRLYPIESYKHYIIASAPISMNGNVAGGILFLSTDEKSLKTATDIEISLIQAFASCLSNQLQI